MSVCRRGSLGVRYRLSAASTASRCCFPQHLLRTLLGTYADATAFCAPQYAELE